MPVIDFTCTAGHRIEHFYHQTESKTVTECVCDCGAVAVRSNEIRQAPAVVWTGPIGQRYRNRDGQDYHSPDGQWAYTRKGPDGEPCAPRAVRLENWQDVKAYAKSEGCFDPRDLPKTVEVGEDGKQISSRGFSGQEV